MRIFWISFSALCLLLAGVFFVLPARESSYMSLEEQTASPRGRLHSLVFGQQRENTDSLYSPALEITPPPRNVSFFNGEDIDFPAEQEYLVGVMIDNARAARAGQVGIDQSSLVFEALAEGGVTRFLAFFSSLQDLQKIGPIRSAREYFWDMSRPLHSLYVHAGGSDRVMEELRTQEDVLNVDHHYIGTNGEIFVRDFSLPRPHNLFTNSLALKQFVSESADPQGLQTLQNSIFSFSDIALEGTEVQKIITNFSAPPYDAYWTWEEKEKKFLRHQDSSSLKIEVNNLVIMEAPMWLIPNDPKGRMEMENVGSGTVLFFQNGQYVRGMWKKQSRNTPLQFFAENGLPLSFLRGKTWIAALDDLQKLEIYTEAN